ncbi:exonuclease VII small subunit [Candidatus Pelagibacter communis]|uniref:exonuclease VII small subunit n=1 Tax=Pelagibacter ubique TaxID=198252 RepID=UPI00094C91A6|nr:exonuclease VII small subunit [Candidatus Pelagibacter ubique]
MKDKNLPNDIQSKSVEELTDLATNIIENLENKKNLENSVEEYQMLIKLNNLIEKKFQKTSKQISEITKDKIKLILQNKNGKKTK